MRLQNLALGLAALLVIGLLTILTACGGLGPGIAGSGDVITLDQDFADFDSLDIGSAFDVEVTQGHQHRVTIRIDDNLVDYLQVAQRGSELRIGLDSIRNYNFRTITVEAEIIMPELSAIDLSGASRASLAGFASSSAFRVDLSGASALRGESEAGDIRMDVSGASDVELSGSGSSIDLDISGNSTADLGDFPVGDAEVKASGASDVTVNVDGTLDVDASGASEIQYLGNPTLGSIELSGASSVGAK